MLNLSSQKWNSSFLSQGWTTSQVRKSSQSVHHLRFGCGCGVTWRLFICFRLKVILVTIMDEVIFTLMGTFSNLNVWLFYKPGKNTTNGSKFTFTHQSNFGCKQLVKDALHIPTMKPWAPGEDKKKDDSGKESRRNIKPSQPQNDTSDK